MNYQEKFMELAVKVAYEGISCGCGGPFGCVIVSDDKVVAKAHNTVIATNDPTAHGEINAIRQASQQLKTFNLQTCELYTTSEPCPMCLAAIMWARIPRVYCVMNIHDAAEIGFDDAPFYREITHYFQLGQATNVEVTFHDDKSCRALFAKYATMDTISY